MQEATKYHLEERYLESQESLPGGTSRHCWCSFCARKSPGRLCGTLKSWWGIWCARSSLHQLHLRPGWLPY